MRSISFISIIVVAIVIMSFSGAEQIKSNNDSTDTLLYPNETHFRNVRQLTFGGDNAEAYFSFDGKWLIFQKTNPKEGILCDQMFIGKLPTKEGEKI